MVVTRKTPLVPPPPTSRTNSSQPTPRTAKSKARAAPSALAVGDDLGAGPSYGPGNSSNGKSGPNDVGSSSHKHKPKSKFKKSAKKSSRITFGDFLMYLILAYVTIHAVRVCPTDVNHESSVCFGLSKYRQLVLEPYIIPVFHRAIAHPSIAPHVKRVKPHFNTAVRLTKPIVRRTQMAWNSRIVPQWNKRVIPQWKKHAVPHLRRVGQLVEPYRSRVTREYSRYTKYISPHLRSAQVNLQRWQRQTRPYVILAATKTYGGYQAAKPYMIPVLNRIKAGMKHLLLFARAQRVLFVDPHVARIWEKVKELSSGEPKGSATLWEESAAPRPAAPLAETGTITTEEPTVLPSASLPSIISSEVKTMASVIAGSSTSATAASMTAADSSTATPESPTVATEVPLVVSTTEPEKVASTSILESTSSAIISSAIPSYLSEEITLPSSDITGPSLITDEPAPTSLEAADEAAIDLDAFAQELGLDDLEPTVDDIPPPMETESEEEIAERNRKKEIETAEARAAIMKRHSKWEADLKDLIKAKKKSLRKMLVAIRKPAAIELKESKQIRAAIDGMVTESEKYIKGAGAYLKTLTTESNKDATKIALWDKLIDKVDAKFRDRVTEMENVVNGWHMDVLNREALEVQRVVDEVNDLAGVAQSDLGMDYSWLADVTYDDWQRYHDLMRVSENFTELAISIQKSTHPSPPINPIEDVLQELESEVENIVESFETQLQQLKRRGESALAGHTGDTDATTSVSEPTFSVLPVPKEEIDREGATGDIPPVVIGRSKEEIVDAFNRAGEDVAGATPPRSVKTESEGVIRSLAQEVYAEADQSTPAPADHVEL